MGIEVVAMMLFAVSTTHAETVYKCTGKPGAPVYQSSPCQTDTIKVLNTDAGPSEAERQRAQARVNAETQRYRAQDEAAARLRAQNRAADMAMFEPTPTPSPSLPKSYYTDKRLVGTKQGWEMKTQNQIDLEAKARAAEAQAAAARSVVTGGMIYDQYGNHYIDQGATAFSPVTGKTCVKAGSVLVSCY